MSSKKELVFGSQNTCSGVRRWSPDIMECWLKGHSSNFVLFSDIIRGIFSDYRELPAEPQKKLKLLNLSRTINPFK